MSAGRSLLAPGGRFVPGRILRTLTASPHGGWDQGPVPILHTYNGKTYLAWFDGSHGNIETASWDGSALSSTGLAFSAVPYDDHNSSCLMVRDDGHLMVAFSLHNSSPIYLRINASPETVTWAAESVIQIANSSLGGGYTYISLIQLRGVSGSPIYCFYRNNFSGDTTGTVAYKVSTDGGATWGAEVILFTGTLGNVPYFSINTDWDTRIDLFTTDTAPGNVGSGASTYHLYIDGTTGTYHQTDGTAITSPPFGAADLTLVESGAGGATWPFGGSYDSLGNPAAGIMRHLESPTNDNDIQVAQWDGAAWNVTDVTTVGGLAAGDRFASGMDIRHDLSNRLYCGRYDGSQFQTWEFSTNDGWASSSGRQLSSDANLNWLVRCPHEEIAGLRAAWLNGTFVSSSSFAYSVEGWG